MKPNFRRLVLTPILALAAFLALGAAPALRAAPKPTATLTVSGLEELQSAVTRFAKIFQPDSAIDAGKELVKGLGLQADSGVDAKRPWQVAVWFEGMTSQPVIAFKIPTGDVEKFKASLSPKGMLNQQGWEWTQLKNGYGLVSLTPSTSMSEPQQAALGEWKGAGVEKPRNTIELTARLSDPLRQQAQLMLGIGKMAMTQSMVTNKAFSAAGGNPKVLGDMFGLYFEVIETVVKGLDQFNLGLTLKEDALLFEESVTANPNTTLASWLAKPKTTIPAGQAAMIDPSALMSFVSRFDMDMSDASLMTRFMNLAFQFQNFQADDPALKEVNDLMKKLFPMNFMGSIYQGDAMTISGIYTFPNSDAASVYAEIKKFMATGMQSMVGKDKMYTSAKLQEKHRTIAGVAVDRFVLVLNTNSPLMTMPSQKEQMLAMWPNGKMEFDYALKNNQVLFGSPSRMGFLLDPASNPNAPKPWTGKLDEGTVFAGTMNFIGFMRYSIDANPMLPPEVKTQMAKMVAKGTEVEMRVSMDNVMRFNARFPIQLFREFAKLRNIPPPEKK